MKAQLCRGWQQQLLLVLVLSSPSVLLSTAHPQRERRGGWEKGGERGRDKPKGGLWILSPSSICRADIKMIEVAPLLEFPP
jgi:hypothetical protein